MVRFSSVPKMNMPYITRPLMTNQESEDRANAERLNVLHCFWIASSRGNASGDAGMLAMRSSGPG